MKTSVTKRRVSPVAAGALSGTPAGIVVVWLLENYVLHAPMPGVVATAVGALTASAVGYIRVAWEHFFGGSIDDRVE